MEKNKVGRPLKFPSPEDMQEKIDEYFYECDDNQIPYTITGLAMALDCDRVTILDYAKKPEFSSTIKKAKIKVERGLELMLIQGRTPAGVIFNLKNNFGWKDKQEIDWKGELAVKKISKEDAEVVKNTFDEIME